MHLLLQNNDKTSLHLPHSQVQDKVKADENRQGPWVFSLRLYIAKTQQQIKSQERKGIWRNR